MNISVYNSATSGEFNEVREALADLLKAFRQELVEDSILPNLTDAFDNHMVMATAHPYATVGLENATLTYLSKAGTAFDLQADIQAQIWLHLAPGDGQFDERLKWALVQSLLNYLKNIGTVAHIDQMWLTGVQGNAIFITGTQGTIIDLLVRKVLSS